MVGQELNTKETVEAFNEAFGRHDVDTVMALMTDDCIFENTLPPPDGEKHVGQADVRRFWETFSPIRLRHGSRRRRWSWQGIAPSSAGDSNWGDGHVRGIDLFKVRDGKVAEKLSYVKG